MTMTQPEVLTEPYQIAPDVFVVPFQQFAPPVGFFCLNSMVVRGREPMIVDTGAPVNRQAWLDGVFGLVEPEDVRWGLSRPSFRDFGRVQSGSSGGD
jgi:hypothetical protein